MTYRHQVTGGVSGLSLGRLPGPGKVVCVGRNYAEHARELNNPVPATPLLFIKPVTSVVSLEGGISIPENRGKCHHELEVAVLIGSRLSGVDASAVKRGVMGYGLGLDLTLRDLQAELKRKGHPWEIAKAFDGACPLSSFVLAGEISDPENMSLQLLVNGVVRQAGNTSEMIMPVFQLIAYISKCFTLEPGDVVLTGTPAGVAPLQPGDQLTMVLDGQYEFATVVKPRPLKPVRQP